MTSSYASRSARGLLVAVILSGCVVTEPIDDGAATEASTAATTGPDGDSTLAGSSGPLTAGDATADGDATETTAATGPGTDDGESTDTGPAGTCPDVPTYQCSEPFDCVGQPCGDVLFPYDENGCLRPPCSNSGECDGDQFCFLPYDAYEICISSGVACSDGPDGTCECVSTPDCSGGYCMTDCYELGEDAASCEAAGCDASTVIGISDTCECTADVPMCTQSPAGIGVPTGYMWHEETLQVAYFGARPWSVPLQWRLCSEPGAPPACGCFDPEQPPECP
jgi:hypothetical protein